MLLRFVKKLPKKQEWIKGFPEAARSALTHTFYNVYEVLDGGFDSRLVPSDLEFLKKWLSENEYDDYDKLTQLADNMASWKGIMTIDDRFCDILYATSGFKSAIWITKAL